MVRKKNYSKGTITSKKVLKKIGTQFCTRKSTNMPGENDTRVVRVLSNCFHMKVQFIVLVAEVGTVAKYLLK